MSIDSNIINRLTNLQDRFNIAVNNPNERPVWFHWSDAVVLSEAINEINDLRTKLENIKLALSETIKIV